MNLDVALVILYFIVMIGCGVIGVFLAKNSDEYMVAGRKLRYWMYFPCLSTVIIGGGATFGSARLSYEHGISGAWVVVMYGLGIITMGLLLASKLANLRVVSISEMLQKRYSAASRYVSAALSVVYTTLLSVVQVIAVGTVLKSFLGWDMTTSMLIGGSIALIYTLLGGMWSVTITDVIQFVLMIVGVFFFLVPASVNAVGGFAKMTASVPPSFLNPVAIGWDQLIMYLLLMYLGIMIGQDIWQRIFTARDIRTARIGTVSAGIFSVLWGGAMAICGLAAYILFPSLEHPQMALAEVVVKVTPPGMLGVVVAALLSALMSSASGQTLAASTLMVNDLIKPFQPGMTAKRELYLSRLWTGIIGVIVLFLALTIKDVLAALDIAYALLSGCVFIPVVAGFFWKRATAMGAICSIVISLIVTVICIFTYGAFSAATITLGFLASAIGLVGGSLLTKADDGRFAEWESMLQAAAVD